MTAWHRVNVQSIIYPQLYASQIWKKTEINFQVKYDVKWIAAD